MFAKVKLKTNYFLCLLWLASLVFSAHGYAANKLEGVRVWAAPDSTRVVFDLKQNPTYSHFTLTKPDRLVVDFKNSQLKFNLKSISHKSKLVKKVRLSTPPNKSTLRLVIDLKQAVNTKIFSLPPTAPYGNRLVVDLEQKQQSAKPVISQPKTMRDVVIAIDAGHGGDDPGSIGPRGTYEKKVTLAIAKRLAKKIDNTEGMSAVLTRSGDYFVNLNKRSEIARKKKADLLISIHADAFTSPHPKGASVWVLSRRRANSEMGRWLEKKEKQSELLGGAGDIIQNADNEQYLAMTLLDMTMDRSMSVSHVIAADVLSDLGRVTKLHKSKPKSASFAVLKSPDIPSLLVETGFISNPREEQQLLSRRHQENLANAIHRGVLRYFYNNPPENSLIAQTSHLKHKVKSGESLSVIALRYGVSIKSLRRDNNLKSDMLRVGQQLNIPRS